MIFYTAKLHRKRILFGIVALVLVCGLFAGYAGFHSWWGAESVSATITDPKVKSNEDRIAYLENLGWSVTPTELAEDSLKIPKEFDASLDEYLALQDEQGFHLADYAGKKIKRYTYGIENYPTGETDIAATIMIYKKHVIGGEIFSTTTGEILHGLTLPI